MLSCLLSLFIIFLYSFLCLSQGTIYRSSHVPSPKSLGSLLPLPFNTFSKSSLSYVFLSQSTLFGLHCPFVFLIACISVLLLQILPLTLSMLQIHASRLYYLISQFPLIVSPLADFTLSFQLHIIETNNYMKPHTTISM